MILLGLDDTSEALRRPLAYGGGGGGEEGGGGVEGFLGGTISVGYQMMVESLYYTMEITNYTPPLCLLFDSSQVCCK